MSGVSVAFTTYFIAIIISFFVAGLIQLMALILTHFSKAQPEEQLNTVQTEATTASSDDAAIATVIAIAKHQ